METTATNRNQLRRAYHNVYDIKDKAEPGGDVFVACYYACQHLADLMAMLDMDPPRRFDRERD